MNKIFTRMLGAAVMSAATLSATAATDEGGNFIYLPPTLSYSYPTQDNASDWEENKLYETSPGSNIYEGTFGQLPWTGNFRFFTELAPQEYSYASYRMNLIHPADDASQPTVTMAEYGTSGVYMSKQLQVCPAAVTESCWSVPQGAYRLRVDLNDNTVYAVPEGTVLMLINDESTPTLSNIGDYTSVENINNCYEAGDIKIYLYDFYNGKWLNPGGTSNEVTSGTNSQMYFIASDSKGSPFTITGWPGGGLKFSSMYYYSTNMGSVFMDVMAAKNYTEVDNDEMFVDLASVSHTPWKGCSDEQRSMYTRLTRNADGTYSGMATVPAGKFRMRIISDLSDKGAEYTVLAPAEQGDRDIVPVNNVFYSSAVETSSADNSYWTCNYNLADMRENGGWNEGNVTITVTPGDKPSVKFEFNNSGEGLYLVGTNNNWDSTDTSNILEATPNGGYYGSFYLEADAEFKFLVTPGDWGSCFGPDFGEGDVDMINGDHISSNTIINGGGGNWILKNWDGGELYMYIRPYANYVYFSSYPIPDSVTGLGEDTGNQLYLYYTDGGILNKLTASDSGDGIYRFSNLYLAGEKNELRLFSRELPISHDESVWEGSYTLCPAITDAIGFDGMGVAEVSFTSQDYVTEAGCAPFTFDCTGYRPYLYWYILTVDTNQNKIYLERCGNDRHYILGTISGNRYPTYETRAEFAQYLVPKWGTIVDVPAGELDFSSYESISDASQPRYQNRQEIEVELTDGIGYPTDMLGLEWISRRITVPGWEGGKVIIGAGAIVDLSTVTELTWYDGTRFTETAPGSLIYKGTGHFKDYCNFGFIMKKYLRDSGWGMQEYYFEISSDSHGAGAGPEAYNEEAFVLIPQNGVMNGTLSFTGNWFYAPSWTGEGDVDFTIDLNDMTLTGVVNNENAGSIYETVSDDNDGLDGLMGFPSTTQDDAVVLAATVSADASFNLTTPQGSVIIPASGNDTPVEFDEAGTWSGEFKRATAPSASRKAVRAAAGQKARWIIDMPEGTSGQVDMLIDEANGIITLVSSAHNKGYYITPRNSYGGNINPVSVEYIDEIKKNMLMPTSAGIWEGDYEFRDDTASSDEDLYLSFDSSLGSAYGLNSVLGYGFDTFDLTDNDTAEQYAYDSDGTGSWTVKGNPEKVHIRYDSIARTLTITDKTTGVEDVVTDLIDSNSPVEYYNLQGIRIENPATGIYIRRQGSRSTKVLIK